jgi:hypothetical protein
MKPRLNSSVSALVVVALLCLPSFVGAVELDDGRGDVALATLTSTAIILDPVVEAEFWVLTLTGPCGPIQKRFGPKDEIAFDIRDLPDDPNGQWTWELRRMPSVDKSVRKALQESRGTGQEQEVLRNFRDRGLLPKGPMGQAGGFFVADGVIVDPESGEEQEPKDNGGQFPLTSAGVGTPGSGTATGGNQTEKAQIISPDGVVYNSLCVGFDCPNNPSFSFDTIRLQENNLRIHFDDTSTAGSYPNQDWRIEANASTNGGGEHFRIQDATANRNIFTLEANAPSNSLVVDSGGRVGMGTANPVVEVHTANGDTPTLRLEQTTASGFQAQSWDVAGNETSFFVRDATNGSTLPFRIRPGAASNSLVIDTDSQVGVGILSPTEKLHVSETANVNTLLVVENNNTGTAAAGVLRAKSDTATVNFQAHGSGRTLSRFGETLGGWTEMLHVSGNGLLIGTVGAQPLILGTSSNNVLEITAAGDVLYQGVAVHSDYVFEPDYELPSIAEQADFMWSNKHLPAIGPARVTEDGREIMELGSDRQAIVEELEKAHIYIAQLHERLEDKDAVVESLLERMERMEQALAESVD